MSPRIRVANKPVDCVCVPPHHGHVVDRAGPAGGYKGSTSRPRVDDNFFLDAVYEVLPREPDLRLVEGDARVFDLSDGAVDDVSDATRIRPPLFAIDDEDLREAPAVEERDPPGDPVEFTDRPDPWTDQK